MPEKSEFFIIIGLTGSQGVISFDEQMRAAFAGMKLTPNGVTTLYFHLPKAVSISEAMQLDGKIYTQLLQSTGLKYKKSNFGIISGGTGPFQIAYELQFAEQGDSDG